MKRNIPGHVYEKEISGHVLMKEDIPGYVYNEILSSGTCIFLKKQFQNVL